MTAMAESRFDIQFAGELVQGADPLVVRECLRDLFKLSPDGLERLFSGRAMVVKRDLDAATAERYRHAFRDAGAVLRLTPSTAALNPPAPAQPDPRDRGSPPPVDATGAEAGLTLAPPGADVGEATAPFAPRHIDTSHLSLVPGSDWTLEDCAPPPVPTPIPDISYLTLAPVEPLTDRTTRDNDE
jgi:hypothetical protein